MEAPIDHEKHPVAYLVAVRPEGDATANIFPLPPGEWVVGRGKSAHLVVSQHLSSVSREHAVLIWLENEFLISDKDSSAGTYVNQKRLKENEKAAIQHGDIIRLGSAGYLYLQVLTGADSRLSRYQGDILHLIREMSSLDVTVIAARSLELLRLISGCEESFLISTASRWKWPLGTETASVRDLNALIKDPNLGISKSDIDEKLTSGKKLYKFLSDGNSDGMPSSMVSLDLKRVWVSPVLGISRRPIAAVCLQSRGPGERFDPSTEELLDAIVAQIGIAIRNAWMHAEVDSLNVYFEERVDKRTRELKRSRERLMSQDRLVTLGRLVAGVAHELNNPSGAIASLAETQVQLLESILALPTDLKNHFSNMDDLAQVEELLALVRESAPEAKADSGTRRQREIAMAAIWGSSQGVAVAHLIRILARTGLTLEQIESYAPLLIKKPDFLAGIIEKTHTFARSTATIRDASCNIARIVDGLKRYSHLDRAALVTQDIHLGLQTTLDVMHSRLSEEVRVVTRFGDIPPFAHRPGEMMQVWTNLIDNALKAMGEKGTLSIETYRENDTAVISIADNGAGVPSELRDRIFELDVTTRGPGAGLGLGLPICRSIVEQNHGGEITFESEAGRTEFTVRLALSSSGCGEEMDGDS
jgi:signal transduction histidine kinase